MNAICTIVAKNYYSFARTLGDSLKKSNPDVSFHILLSDEISDDISFDYGGYDVTEAKDLELERFNEISYKYDITEFCTSVKPYFIKYLLNKYKYDKIIYLDPDILVLDSLDEIYLALEKSDIVLTPHVVDEHYSHNNIDQEKFFLGSGTFNLGFVGFNSSLNALKMLDWWHGKLLEECFSDKNTFVFTDQKWMNLIPCLFPNVHIERSKKYNIAWWNFNERTISQANDDWYVDDHNVNSKIVFVHFSGYKPTNENNFSRDNIFISKEKKEILKVLFSEYQKLLLGNYYDKYISLDYKYFYYENGIIITRLQRRIFRALLKEGYKCHNPFDVNKGSYFHLLSKNRLLIKEKSLNYNRMNTNKQLENNRLLKLINIFLRILKNIIGLKNYSYLIRYMNNCMTDENQLFLIKDKYYMK